MTPADSAARALDPGMSVPGFRVDARADRQFAAVPGRSVPALLTQGTYYGTLAAVRCLGRAGVRVTMAEGALLAPARWSRYVSRRVDCPSTDDVDAFLEWLVRFGEREPGHVLCPASDDLAWLFARHAAALSGRFRMLQPGIDAVHALLDKKRLYAAGRRAGLESPRTWFPEGDGDLARVAKEASFPVLVKPRTQVLFRSRSKGVRVESASALDAAYRAFEKENRYLPALTDFDPGVASPMVQELLPDAARGIYGVAGFADGTGVVARASVKVLQRPRRLGIGLCFEQAPLRDDVAQGLERLFQATGFRGVFEAEFAPSRGRLVLLDFNPRFYSQMAFEADRGLPLPLLFHLAAAGDEAGLKDEIARARAATGGPRVYRHRFLLELMLRGQVLSGALDRREAGAWREWLQRHADATDAAAAPDDTGPLVADLAMHAAAIARHPRSFVRSMILNR